MASNHVEGMIELEDLDTISAMYGIMPHPGSMRRHAAMPAPGAKHVPVHRRSVVHKPRMPTSLERKLQDARAQLYKQLGVPGDPQRPTSPGTLHRLLARMQSRSRSGKAGHSTATSHTSAARGSTNMPGSCSTAQGASSPARSAGLQLSSITAPSEPGKLPNLPSTHTAAGHKTASGAKNSKTLTAVQDTAGPAQGATEAAWSAGRGRVSPHINFSLSILPTATEELARDKTLYYSPIGGLAGTSSHQFASTLREPGSMLMYSTPQQKATILGQWDKVDAKLQQQLLDAALAGPTLKGLQQQGTAGLLDFEAWIYGPQQDRQPVPPTVQRVQELAHKMQLHPNVLWELLGPAYEEQAWSGVCEQQPCEAAAEALQAGNAAGGPDNESAQKSEPVQSLRKSVSYAPGCVSSNSRGVEAPDGSGQQLSEKQLGRVRSRVGAGGKVLTGMLRRAPAGFKALHATGEANDSQPPANASQVQIDEGLKSAQYAQHSLHGTPITGSKTHWHMPGPQGDCGQQTFNAACHSTTHAADACIASNQPEWLPGIGTGLQGQAHANLCEGVRQQMPDVMRSQTTPLPSPRYARQCGPSRSNSPPQHTTQHVLSHQVGSPARDRSPHQAPNASLVQPQGDALGADVVGRISHRYVAAARQQEWQPWVPGAVRPSTGERWDYHTGVYDNHLADELVTQQLLHRNPTTLPSPPANAKVGPVSVPSPHSNSQGGKFATRSPWLLAFAPPEEGSQPSHKKTQQHLRVRSTTSAGSLAVQKTQGVTQAASMLHGSLRASAPAKVSAETGGTAQLEAVPSPGKVALRRMVGHSVLRWHANQQRVAASPRVRSAGSPHQQGDQGQAMPVVSPALATSSPGAEVLPTGAAGQSSRVGSSRAHHAHRDGATSMAPSLASSRHQKVTQVIEASEEQVLAQELARLADRFDIPAQTSTGLITAAPYLSSPSGFSESVSAAGMLASLDSSSAVDKERDKLAASKARLQGSAVPRMGKEQTVLETRPYTSMHIRSQLQESHQVQQQLLAVERDLTPLFARQRQEQARKMGA